MNYEQDSSNKTLTFALYILYIIAIFSAGILAIIALIINYVKMNDVRGTIYESHFKWQINTFWWYLIWNVIAFIPFIFLFFTLDDGVRFTSIAFGATVFCIAVVGLSWVWIVYRAIRGLIALNDNQAV
ncbi:hypothetical protein RFI36_19025 [Acinetobacter gerneri]|uniref:Transmembrane protein n=1 Tax=Acinetobacter gerneri TaxID=202952 RepID=A0AAW8JML6_9GAMM|nr:hypothetical protein [Acinetobacter gerneri]MDQ9011810.1 hypothetical protein [Acinetobacter gerneri]MDQ9015915.1 hypothetical protein [Acinetobacter gerneri]MDQ9027090.1 hypothetical protein [Acinetobacter gerneri]MDQ9054373.1 hypothetical protein [Acinetobacter gerneri]MDQ9062037.1 hypothetical protein [Acinetobacter gerneri]